MEGPLSQRRPRRVLSGRNSEAGVFISQGEATGIFIALLQNGRICVAIPTDVRVLRRPFIGPTPS